MAKSTPSLLALLGLVAVAGYQNRGRISEMLADARRAPTGPVAGGQARTGSGGFLDEIAGLFGGSAPSGGPLASGLSELVNRFKASGQAAPAESWVSGSANMPVDVEELAASLGEETLEELTQKTGLSRPELLLRLNTALPEVVNRFTPHGRLPTETEARNFG